MHTLEVAGELNQTEEVGVVFIFFRSILECVTREFVRTWHAPCKVWPGAGPCSDVVGIVICEIINETSNAFLYIYSLTPVYLFIKIRPQLQTLQVTAVREL